ncbi:4Fe-4S ferredoxin-type, iron-sulphur binding domain protein [Acididesulfobacillus acetoxydans]|uniref:4Fe-4S ferredoxin iron-sulfur binding domain protein n=1 Tax=Acididesulfobacillus acetoxydans TaxID=1561005 RepID=A0A8S0WZM8_9FIRM|nr:4Fe-4S ferredoxin-type, iron-sulphur binding domain protein [Acididesulfobacillus acetoxydans]CEJ08106.1 4Fe-4S ferredoxin iron-sulfur binding domain protein [Acididesulfobacillus acetoxydans]
MAVNSQMLHHPYNCLNVKKPFARACRICIDACPHQAISEFRKLDPATCTECGVCMAACPSDGFVDRGSDGLHDYLFQAEEIVLNCPQAAPLGWEIPCLGLADRDLWLTLMLLARSKPVRILTGACAECEDRRACARSVEIFGQLHEEWPEHPFVQIQVKPDRGEEVVKPSLPGARRPAGLKEWRELGWKKVEGFLPGLAADETYDIPRTRQWLAEALEGCPEEEIPFQALFVGTSCTSCGVCTAICPQGALEKREKEGRVQLVLRPIQCVQCRRCVEICQSKALDFVLKPFSHRVLTGKILLHEGSPRYCGRCGKQIFDNSEPPLCIACATSAPEGDGNISSPSASE